MSESDVAPELGQLAPAWDKPVDHSIVLDAIRLYRNHARLFSSLVFLPTIVGALFLWGAQFLLTAIRASIPSDMQSRLAAAHDIRFLLKVWLINISGFLGSWLCWAFAFVAVIIAAKTILEGRNPDPEDCFNAVREHPFAFLKSSVVLFFEMLVMFYFLTTVAFILFFSLFDRLGISSNRTNSYWLGLFDVTLMAAITLPFLFALPESVMAGLGLFGSLKRSFTLTEGKSLVMLGLFLETELTAYAVSWLIRWIIYHGSNGEGFRLLYGGAFYLEILTTAFLQPIAMIGFALVYVNRIGQLSIQAAEMAHHGVPDVPEIE